MKKWLVSILMLSIISTGVSAFDVNLLKNDKEIESRILSEDLLSSTRLRLESRYEKEDLQEKLLFVLGKSINMIIDYDKVCDQRISKEIFRGLDYMGLPNSQNDISDFFIYLRATDLIDDILYRILSNNNKLYFQVEDKDLLSRYVQRKNVRAKVRGLETKDNFQSIYPNWPNARNKCPLYEVNKIDSYVKKSLNKKSYAKSKRFTDDYYMLALKNQDIDTQTYNRMMIIRDHDINDWPVSLYRYLSIVRYSKNKLINELDYLKNADNIDETFILDRKTKKYLHKYKDRALKLTKREALYRKYSDEQIMMLADVLVKASKRMNAYESRITIQYRENDLPEEYETYVISPMEQYRMSLKMLQKDMDNLTLSKLFKGRRANYDEIILAAYETGVFGQSELEYIIEFEEFWNPKTPTWKIITKYVFGLAGTASFYLPPPWNIVGAIGLVFTETQVFKRNKKVNADKNTNSIF